MAAPIYQSTEILTFGGKIEQAITQNNLDLSSGKYTQEAWIHVSNVIKNDDWAIFFTMNDQILFSHGRRFMVGHSGVGYEGLGARIDTGKWNHIAATFDGEDKRLYLNGQELKLKKDDKISGKRDEVTPDLGTSLVIGGGDKDVLRFAGEMKHVKLYNKALTDVEIKDSYAMRQHELDRDEDLLLHISNDPKPIYLYMHSEINGMKTREEAEKILENKKKSERKNWRFPTGREVQSISTLYVYDNAKVYDLKPFHDNVVKYLDKLLNKTVETIDDNPLSYCFTLETKEHNVVNISKHPRGGKIGSSDEAYVLLVREWESA